MTKPHDRECDSRAAPDAALGLVGALPALHTQDAVVIGQGVNLPTRLRFRDLPGRERPRTGGAFSSGALGRATQGREIVGGVLDRWRAET